MGGVGLLLLLGALQGFLSQKIHVSQIPAVTTTEGSTVTLQCDYTLSSTERARVGSYRWYRHGLGGPEVSDSSKDFMGRVSSATQSDFIDKRSADMKLHRVILTDTGMYVCQVEIQDNEIISGHGNGTFLNVTAAAPNNPSGNILPVSLGVAAVVLIISISVAAYLRYTKPASSYIREVSPTIYTDFTTPATRNDGVQSPTLQQPLQSSEDGHYSLKNLEYTYLGCQENSKKPTLQQNAELDLYSEIP
ncbi:natural cytotoxicity triggering receptor 3-like isoform X1 [Ascaphus truei]|uniref:natural cytotoxicity triggering receptor 3-like isoform X1 n=1 Tax=Ascaphus truei TaxID=8439 RepID=UPI003F5AA124